ncbi:MAG: DUF3048 domain-containing protein [Chloroflexi bacterium]|nr:MAG: DUF3048 domain-containing protein [Chloroflexota bacterium]
MRKPLFPSALALVILAAATLASCGSQGLSPSIAKTRTGYIRLNEPVVVNFSLKVDPKSVKATVSPATDFTVNIQAKKAMLTPTKGWQPGKKYTLSLKNVRTSDHTTELSSWKGSFNTQPLTGIAGFLIDGKAVPNGTATPTMGPLSKVTITFTAPMKIETAAPTLNDKPVPAPKFSWAPDTKSVDVVGPYLPFQALKFGVLSTATTAKGDLANDLTPIALTTLGLEPSNSTSQISAGFATKAALLVVIDDAGQARPQAGLQGADMAFEYISEYSISRFTLLFFNNPSSTIGPVRSCRMINAYLLEAFHGIQMCSGGSVGTLHYFYGNPLLASNINDFDNGSHYFRVGFKPAPHNLYTDQGRALRLRDEQNIGAGPYVIDPAHNDVSLGSPTEAPSIPLHGVNYSFDDSCSCYRPFDQGSPRTDSNTGGQLGVKNVVIMKVPFHDAGWVEDENGGAHSIWYDMNGTGSAEIWSNGRMVHAIWHQGAASNGYYENTTQPMYFTDESGNLLRLNTGLTWVHVVGDGQTS